MHRFYLNALYFPTILTLFHPVTSLFPPQKMTFLFKHKPNGNVAQLKLGRPSNINLAQLRQFPIHVEFGALDPSLWLLLLHLGAAAANGAREVGIGLIVQ